jgi:hypothetical protein
MYFLLYYIPPDVSSSLICYNILSKSAQSAVLLNFIWKCLVQVLAGTQAVLTGSCGFPPSLKVNARIVP